MRQPISALAETKVFGDGVNGGKFSVLQIPTQSLGAVTSFAETARTQAQQTANGLAR